MTSATAGGSHAGRTPTPGLPGSRQGAGFPPPRSPSPAMARGILARNAVPIRTQRTPDPGQPLPAFPAKAPQIACKALREARDRARYRRQIPENMSVTNYVWKGKGRMRPTGRESPPPPHIGQSDLESIGSPTRSPTEQGRYFLQEGNAEGQGAEGSEVPEQESKKKGPPEAVRRIGYVMKYRPRLQPRAWRSDGYIGNVSQNDQIKCLLASSETEFKNSAPWVEIMQNGMLNDDRPRLSRSGSSLSLHSADYEWIKPDFGSMSAQRKSRLREGIGRKGFTVEGILNGAAEGPIDLRRDGDMEYIGAIDHLGQRTRSAAFGVDRFVGSKFYTGARFSGVNDMGLRLRAYENGFQLEAGARQDLLADCTETFAQKSEEWPVDEQGLPAPFWPPRKVPVFNRSERKDVQSAFAVNPDRPVAAKRVAIPFEVAAEKSKKSPPRPRPDAKDEEREYYTLHHAEDLCPGPSSHPGANFRLHHQGKIIEETSKDLALDNQSALDESSQDSDDMVEAPGVCEHFYPAKPLTFEVQENRQKARSDSIERVMIEINWTEYFDDADHDEDEPQLTRQNAMKNLMIVGGEEDVKGQVDDGPQRRRARACIHTETVLPDEESTWLPEALVGRRRNRALSLVFVEDIEAMEEQLGFYHPRHTEHEAEAKMMERHWYQMKRTFESVVISCPETMRVHMVRYNLQSNMQQYKLDGLVAALVQVEGGQEAFFATTLPHVIARASSIGDMLKADNGAFPVMRKDESRTFEIPRVQVAAILCNMMLCSLPNNDFSFSELLCSNQSFQITKLCCFLNYFRRLSLLSMDEPKGKIRFVRSTISGHFNWRKCQRPLTSLKVHTEGQMLDANPATNLHVVPAYKNTGGGMLFRRCTPEEAHLCNRPELCIAMIVVPPLGDLEALHMSGAERYNETAKAGLHLSFIADHKDMSPKADDGLSFAATMVAIDACKFDDYKDSSIPQQISRENMQRDLDKGYVAFRGTAENRVSGLDCVSCSSWGQGAPYRGEQEVKVLLLWMAASANEKSLEYYSHGVIEILQASDLKSLVEAAIKNEYTVSDLYMALAELSASQLTREQLFPSLLDHVAIGIGDHQADDDDADDLFEPDG